MRSVPKLAEFSRYPVTAGTAILATATTAAWWSKMLDMSPLFETAMIRRGELWRLLTSSLLHSNVLHLAFNIYWLWVFGTFIEEKYGHLRTAGLITVLALGSGALEFAFAVGGIGLSGVGYGLFGFLWYLSAHDERFRDAIDSRTVQLFVMWFFFCIVTTLANVFSVGNVAHATGAALGVLIAIAIIQPHYRRLASTIVILVIGFGLWGSTFGRPKVNVSGKAGFEEGKWGYDALLANHNQEAVRWFKDATAYQPGEPSYWFDLGIAYQRLGNKSAAHDSYERAHDLKPEQAEISAALKNLE